MTALRSGGGLGAGGLGTLGLGRSLSTTLRRDTGSLVAGAVLSGRPTVVPVNPPGVGAMPGIRIQIALTGTIWEGSNWVDIAPFVRSFSTKRGRQHELQRPEAGTATLQLSNVDGRFNPWSTNSPYYNQLPPTDANPTEGIGTWTASAALGEYRSGLLGQGMLGWSPLGSGLAEVSIPESSPVLVRTSATPRYGQYAWSITATTSGSMSMVSDSKTAATPRRTYTAYAWVRSGPGTPNRSVTVSILWKNASGAVIQTTAGPASAETSAWQTAPFAVRGVCPTGAVSKDIEITIATAHTGDTHVVACAGISDVTYATPAAVTQGWCVGQRAPLTQATPVRITAKRNGFVRAVFTGAIATWVPRYSPLLGTQAVKAYDYMHVLGLMPLAGNWLPGFQRTDGAICQWLLSTAKTTTRVTDSSGHGYTGTVAGSPTFGEPGGLYNTDASTAVRLGRGATITGAVPSGSGTATIEFLLSPGGGATSAETCVQWGSGVQRLAVLLGPTVGGKRRLVVGHGTTTTTVFYTDAGTTIAELVATTTPPAPWHHIMVVKTGGRETVELYLDGILVWHGSCANGTRTTFEVGTSFGVYACVALYQEAFTAIEVARHYAVFANGFTTESSGLQIRQVLQTSGVPSAAIGTIDAGTVECIPPLLTKGETQVLSVVQTAENTEQGFFYCSVTGPVEFASAAAIAATTESVATFANDGTPDHIPPVGQITPSADDQTLWNYVVVGIQGSSSTATASTFFATTPASIARYGARMLTGYTGMYFENEATAQALASRLCSRYATPKTRVRSVSCSNTATSGKWLTTMLELALLDYVTVWFQPNDGSASPFNQKSQIEQIVHVVTKTTWTTSLMLMPTTIS